MLLYLLLACAEKSDTGAPDAARGPLTDTGSGGPGGPGGDGPGGDGPGGDGADDTAETETGQPGDDTGGAWTGEPGDHTLSHDGRSLWLHVPDGYDGGAPLPLVIGFHGAGDSGSNFYAVTRAYGWSAAASPSDFALLVPDTKSPYGDFAIWSGNINDDVDEMITEMDEILAAVDWLGETWRLDAQNLHAFGFSDGGAFTAIAGMSHADRFASLTVVSYGWGGFYPLVTPSRVIPIQFACGTSDSFYRYAEDAEAYLAGQGHDTRLLSISGVGHSFSGVMGGASPEDLSAWMLARPLP